MDLFKRNYAITNSRQVTLIVVPTIFTTLAILCTCLRLYARRLTKARPQADDYFCIAATILAIALLGCDIAIVVVGGEGNSMSQYHSPKDVQIWLNLLFAIYLIWVAAVSLVQLAILCLYHRMFSIVKWFRITIYILMGLVVVWFLTGYISDFALCQPVSKLWKPNQPGTCGNPKQVCTSVGLVHSILDFAILLIPLPLVWNLKTSVSNKVVITLVLLAGCFASISALLRLECLFNLTGYEHPEDLPRAMWLSLVYHFAELPVAIICCCIPILQPVAVSIKSSRLGSSFRGLWSRRTSVDSTHEDKTASHSMHSSTRSQHSNASVTDSRLRNNDNDMGDEYPLKSNVSHVQSTPQRNRDF